jgi:hypothetical protein
MGKTSKMNEEIKAYATGKQDIDKYKRLLFSGIDGRNVFVKLKWPKNIRLKLRAKFLQKIKGHRMVYRLKQIQAIKHQNND